MFSGTLRPACRYQPAMDNPVIAPSPFASIVSDPIGDSKTVRRCMGRPFSFSVDHLLLHLERSNACIVGFIWVELCGAAF
jgi:hypothetical protein